MANEREAREKLANMIRAGARVTHYLHQPSFTKKEVVEGLIPALHDQIKALVEVVGKDSANKATVHQSLHLPEAILRYGMCDLVLYYILSLNYLNTFHRFYMITIIY